MRRLGVRVPYGAPTKSLVLDQTFFIAFRMYTNKKALTIKLTVRAFFHTFYTLFFNIVIIMYGAGQVQVLEAFTDDFEGACQYYESVRIVAVNDSL